MPLIGSRLHTFHDAAIVAANGADMGVGGWHTLAVHITGAAGLTSATIAFQVSVDGTNFDACFAQRLDSGAISTSHAVAASDEVVYILAVAGMQKVRMDLTAITVGTGSVTVKGYATVNVQPDVSPRNADGSVVQGNVAHNAIDSGNPVKLGGRARTSVGSPVAHGDRVDLWVTDYGELAVFLTDEGGNLIINNQGAYVQGKIAHNGVDAGNPLKIGGRARTSVGSAVANNDRVDAWFSDYGEQAVFITDENGNLLGKASSTSADNQAGTTNMLMVASRNVLYNGSTWDRQRGVVETAYLASTPRTATPSTADRTNYNFRGLSILVDVTALADTPSVQITLEIKDTIGNYITIWTAAAAITNVTGTGQYAYLIYPTAENTEGWTETVATVLGSRTYRVLLTHADADSITYSVDVEELV